ncbi:MATE family efflux transporter [Anaerocolumna xylanovorans]|uniref:Putative efflux protein, MATE family n=1 Tax=Anaerocolumna xylanovorans DSM 12503 TaxID=1121345 RepID=A0A1M7Y4Q7_9FIRM|nr:MATE family efflux transporter [Anaerocolumna xylanovorans]SHO47321.1 putative efflux protein, MATE family [Anaerocolumna xylanovorans DSM 12503]
MSILQEKQEKKAFYKLVFSLVFPMALQNLINVGVTSTDVILLGKVGETSLSAASLAGQVQFIMTLIFFGLTSGAAVLTAQYWGKKDTVTIEKIMAITMRFALVVGVLFTLAVLLFPEHIMRIFTSEQNVIDQGVRYLKIIAFSYIFIAFTMIYLNIMRSVERVVVSTVVYMISFVINLVLNLIFIFGLFGLEPMGIRGAALGTLIARACEVLMVTFYALKVNKTIHFHLKALFIRDKILSRDFLHYSVPVMLNELLWGAGVAANAAIIGHLGQSVVAANSVTQVVRQLATVITFGVSNATAIILGKAIGEGKEELAKLYAKRLVRITIFLGLFGSVVILFVGNVAGHYMNLSGEAHSYLKFMMFVMSYFVIAQAFNTTMIVGVFRAGGDTRFGLILDASTLWGVAILFGALAAFVLKLPIPIVYVIIMSDEIIKVPLSAWRYRSMKWVRNVTR